jgi:hypothetical protein
LKVGVEKKGQAKTRRLQPAILETKMCTGCERGAVDSYLESGKTPKEDAKKKGKAGDKSCANTGSSTSERRGRISNGWLIPNL